MSTPDLHHLLDAIERDAVRVLARERHQRNVRPALRDALLAMTTVTLVYLACFGIAHWVEGELAAPATWILVLTVLVPGAVFFLVRAYPGHRAISTAAALTEADQRHGLADRLRTAHEFAQRGELTPFMAAALLDAEAHARRIGAQGLPRHGTPTRYAPKARLATVFLAGAFALAVWIPTAHFAVASGDRPTSPGVTELAPRTEPDTPEPKEQPVAPIERVAAAEPLTQPAVTPGSGQGRKDAQLDTDVKKTRGAMGSGQSADAASASGNSEARGAPSSQAQASKAGKKPNKKKKTTKKRDRKPPDQTPTPAKKPEDDSGATAGRGAASGSNKSPSASPWSSKDQVTSEDEEDLEDDEEVDDEFDNSDARGGVQPHLRDRRPPVNRDLGIGFGNGKNPDANGRGGPSEMKKSRGVAALVLGVPIPDHIKGRPNPGKTKITQERVEPKVEDPRAETAAARAPRQTPMGHFANPTLEPWMRDLIRSYFKAIRQSTTLPKKSGD